jgi:hypothetical protein
MITQIKNTITEIKGIIAVVVFFKIAEISLNRREKCLI